MVLSRASGETEFYADKVLGLDKKNSDDSVLVVHPIKDGDMEWVTSDRLASLRPFPDPNDEPHPPEFKALINPSKYWLEDVKEGWMRVSDAVWRAARLEGLSVVEEQAKREQRRAADEKAEGYFWKDSPSDLEDDDSEE